FFRVAFDEFALLRRGYLERALQEQALHECADIQANLAPQGRVVGFEDYPLRTFIEAGFDVKRQTADGNVLPFGAGLVVALERACSPDYVAVDLELAQAVDGLDVQVAVLQIGEAVLQPGDSGQAR